MIQGYITTSTINTIGATTPGCRLICMWRKIFCDPSLKTTFLNMVRTTSDKKISKTFQGFFKDKLQFSRTKIYSEFKNQHSLIPFWTPHEWLKQVMESFATFTSSATVDHVIFYFPQQHSAKWLAIFYCILGAKRIWNKETEVKYCSSTKMLLCYPWVLWVLTPRMRTNFPQRKKN